MWISKNREGWKNPAKWIRLQKLRAALFLIGSLQSHDILEFYAYLEHQGDITTIKKNSSWKEEYIEEDKNYDTNSSFTIKSKQVLNTLNIFLDIFIEKKYSKYCFFWFYTTNSVWNEKQSDEIKTILKTIDWESILKILVNHEYDDNFINNIKNIILDYYKKDYQKEEWIWNYSILEKFTLEQWKSFFDKINWSFDSDDIPRVEKELLEKIEDSKHFNLSHEWKTKFILGYILDELDKKLISDDMILNWMHSAEIKNIFLEIWAKNLEHEEDPLWKMWNDLEAPTDKRNLKDKVLSFYSECDINLINKLSRKACKSKIIEDSSRHRKSFLSMKYRVYEKCLDEIVTFSSKPKSEDSIIKFIDELKSIIHTELKELESIFNHKYNTNDFIEWIIIDLIDSCYLNFDKN